MCDWNGVHVKQIIINQIKGFLLKEKLCKIKMAKVNLKRKKKSKIKRRIIHTTLFVFVFDPMPFVTNGKIAGRFEKYCDKNKNRKSKKLERNIIGQTGQNYCFGSRYQMLWPVLFIYSSIGSYDSLSNNNKNKKHFFQLRDLVSYWLKIKNNPLTLQGFSRYCCEYGIQVLNRKTVFGWSDNVKSGK